MGSIPLYVNVDRLARREDAHYQAPVSGIRGSYLRRAGALRPRIAYLELMAVGGQMGVYTKRAVQRGGRRVCHGCSSHLRTC